MTTEEIIEMFEKARANTRIKVKGWAIELKDSTEKDQSLIQFLRSEDALKAAAWNERVVAILKALKKGDSVAEIRKQLSKDILSNIDGTRSTSPCARLVLEFRQIALKTALEILEGVDE